MEVRDKLETIENILLDTNDLLAKNEINISLTNINKALLIVRELLGGYPNIREVK